MSDPSSEPSGAVSELASEPSGPVSELASEPSTASGRVGGPSAAVNPRPLLDVRVLTVHRPIAGGLLRDRVVGYRRVVDGVSLQIARGEAYGLVGESGSGAALLGRAIVRLVEPDGGRVLFDGTDLADLRGGELRAMRRHFQMVFPDLRAGLDPRWPVVASLAEAARAHGLSRGDDGKARLRELADAVGLPVAALSRYPHELTDLQRRRAGIAAALCVEPDLVVFDEPVAALDVSDRAQMVNLMVRLRAERDLSYLVISRDVALVRHVSDRVGVLYRGGLVEEAPAHELSGGALHPYTRALLAAVPVPDPDIADRRERIVLAAAAAEQDETGDPPTGCRFHPACPWRQPQRCAQERPQLRVLDGSNSEHSVACHFAEAIRRGTLRPQRPPGRVRPGPGRLAGH